jgi:uncharacterized protein YbaR (Trm112 family)
MPDTEVNADVVKASGVTGERTVDPKLLEILVCPLTKTPLRYDAGARELISDQAGLAFPIRNGVPIMLVDEARMLDDDPVAEGVAALAGSDKDGTST